MKHKPALQLLLPVALLVIATSCKVNRPASEDATYVRYRINYLESMAGDIPTRRLPRTMDCYYSKDFVFTEIDGFFGQFKLNQIADLRKKEVITLLNFFGNKYAYTSEKGELPASVLPIEDMTLELTKDTAVIAGLLSYKVHVLSPGNNFDIYYTPDIPIKRPNITTPYSKIDYPLSDFRVTLSMLKMQLVISEFRSEIVPPGFYEVPEGYKKVSRSEMEDIINSLFTKE